MVLGELPQPIVLAPMAGGPSTPELCAAVSNAGGLGFLASGYLTAEQTGVQIGAARGITPRPLGVNVFMPGSGPADPVVYEPYLERLRGWAQERSEELGPPAYGDDDYDAKIDVLLAERPAVVSFTFGCPPAALVERLHAAGCEAWVTVTSPEEAADALAVGPDALVVQGSEAGGHRGSWVDRENVALHALMPLLQRIRTAHDVPMVAAGGIATRAAVEAVLAAGASAAQVGTAFMLCPEAGTNAAHREALVSGRETALTRAFSGRLARGIRNEFMDEHDAAAPIAYPEINSVTAPLRKAARERGDASVLNLWAGESHRLAEELPAADVVARLAPGD